MLGSGALAAVAAAYDPMEGRPDMGARIGKTGSWEANAPGRKRFSPTLPRKSSDFTVKPWSHLPKEQRWKTTPPYSPPEDRIYNTKAGPVPGKINVHIVPHSHDDTGWQVTVDQYFFEQVYYVCDTIVTALEKDPNRRFMFVEIAFFARWWEEQPDSRRNVTRRLVEEGRLEFINGGWCMFDEASPHFVEMVDQTTRGHQWLKKNFGSCANPRGTWQVDPFGHSSTNAWLLSAEAGMQSLFWGRTDYQDFNLRKEQSRLEWLWQGSESLGREAMVFTGEIYGQGGGGYGTWIGFDGNGDQVQDNPKRHDYNVDQWVDKFIQDAMSQASHTKTEHQLWACGSDFNYQNAEHWYHNLDKLIHYVNLNGTVNAFYSTPTLYTDQKFKANTSWEVRKDDIFPLADAAHNYWTGYFTSRPSLKKLIRTASGFLNTARQLEVLSGVTKEEVNFPTTRPSPAVGDSWTDSLEGTIGVATHHDGMSGTERQDVANDYALRIAESATEARVGAKLALQKLLGGDANAATLEHCHCNTLGTCLNISLCAYTTSRDSFSVVAWNQKAQEALSAIRLPVVGSSWSVTGPSGEVVPSQVVAIDDRTKSLPLLYINYYNLSKAEVAEQQEALANKATHILTFMARVQGVGYAVFSAKKATALHPHEQRASVIEEEERAVGDLPIRVGNDMYTLTFDEHTKYLAEIKNMKSGLSTKLNVSWGWYNSSTGGCTPGILPYEYSCSTQASGAYIFRPNSSDFWFPGPVQKPTLRIFEGPLVTEVHQSFSNWVTQVFRLTRGQPYVELEYTVGPIPIDTPWMEKPAGVPGNWGKEVSVRYDTDLRSNGTFYTDSNGREMIRRQYNARGPSYPKLNVSEPVAGNYYPVNTMISLDDGRHEFTVLTDVTQGGASLLDGSLELMVHRRVQQDDGRGVQEPLNETMCGCNDINAQPGQMGAHGHEGDGGCECAGLTMRGRHWLVFDTLDAAHAARRALSEEQNFPLDLAFMGTSTGDLNAQRPVFSALARDLPPNVKLQTLTSNYASSNGGKMLFRLAHLYGVGEHSTLSQPVTLDLKAIFGSGYSITDAQEMSLTANQGREETEKAKFAWKTETTSVEAASGWTPMSKDLTVTLRPMEVKTYFVTFQRAQSLSLLV